MHLLKAVLSVLFLTVLAACSLFPTEGNEAETVMPPREPGLGEELVPTDTITIDQTPELSITPDSSALFQPGRQPHMMQAGTPAAVQNFVQPDAGCDWVGVGGQVFNLLGQPVSGLVVEVRGTLAGTEVSRVALTGSSIGLGEGGFEVKLAEQPIASQGALYLQIKDLSGTILSRPSHFNTYDDCERNLILVNFIEVEKMIDSFFPLVLQNGVSK